MKNRLVICAIACFFALQGCVTKVENTYTVNGDNNDIRATDTVQATPSTTDLIDAAGTGSGSATTNGGK